MQSFGVIVTKHIDLSILHNVYTEVLIDFFSNELECIAISKLVPLESFSFCCFKYQIFGSTRVWYLDFTNDSTSLAARSHPLTVEIAG